MPNSAGSSVSKRLSEQADIGRHGAGIWLNQALCPTAFSVSGNPAMLAPEGRDAPVMHAVSSPE